MREMKYLLACCLLSLFLGASYSFKELQLHGCNEEYVVRGDTFKFDFYNRYPEDNITIEWRKCPKKMNNQCRDEFHYVKTFRIKNNFSHDIYLERILTGAGYCIPGCFMSGLLKPGSIGYSSLYFDLDGGKTSVRRGVQFLFTFCPNTPEAELYRTYYTFEGDQK